MSEENVKGKGKSYSYKTRREKIRLKLIDGMDSICDSKDPQAVEKAKYYNSFGLSKTDPLGSYTGVPSEDSDTRPVQDADDL